MAVKKLYYGSGGPILYDDSDALNDSDFSGVLRHAGVTNGQMYVEGTPSNNYHVLRKIDLVGLVLQLTTESIVCNDNEVICHNDEVVLCQP